MRKLFLFLAITVLAIFLPLSVPSSAQGEDEEKPETTEQAEEDDPNIFDRTAKCNRILNPLAKADCLKDAFVAEGAQEAVDVATGAALSAWSLFVEQFLGSALAFLYEVTQWWVDEESLINTDGGQSLVVTFQSRFVWFAGFMVVGGIIWQGTRVIYQRKPDGLGVAASALIKYLAVSIGGVTIIQQVSEATDEWAGSIVEKNAATFEATISDNESGLNVLIDTNPGLAFTLAIFLIIGGIAQTALFILRDLSLLVLSGFVVFAASGQFFQFSRSWLGKVISPILAILFYKPLAAMIMAIALDLLNSESLVTIVAGTAMVFLSAFSIKPFMKIFAVFTPEGMSPIGSGGGLGLGGMAMGAGAVGMAVQASAGGGGGDSPSGASPPTVSPPSPPATHNHGPPSSAPQISAPAAQQGAQAATTTGATTGATSTAAASGSPHAMAAMAAVEAAKKGPETVQAAGTKMGDTMSGGT